MKRRNIQIVTQLHLLLGALLFCILFVRCSTTSVISGSGDYEVGIDSISYDHDKLEVGDTVEVEIDKRNVLFKAICGDSIKSAKLSVLLNLGEDYNYGKNEFQVKVALDIKGISPSGITRFERSLDSLKIDQSAPEQIYQVDFTEQFDSIDYFRIIITDYNFTELVNSDINLEIYVSKEYYAYTFNQYDETIPLVYNLSVDAAENPMTLEWYCPCEIPLYQVQVLRLYNNNSSKTADEQIIDAEVNWDQALNIETDKDSLVLTIAEGAGYYTWRARPIGNLYDGEEANDKNWGLWSDGPESMSFLSLSGYSGMDTVFFYEGFDEDMNWIFNRRFNEDHKIAEGITYFSPLLYKKQSQAYIHSEDMILVSQKVQDFVGRPTLQTMAAPVEQDYFSYVEKFIQDENGNIYTAENFDADENYNNPDSIEGGQLSNYYSDDNTDLRIPAAKGYPFTRTLYLRDESGKIEETSGAGLTHAIGQGRTTKFYYANPSDSEIIKIFGDEADSSSSVVKIINIDPNKVARVQYVSKSGQVLATCLASNEASVLLDTLSSQQREIVTDILTANMKYGDNGIQSSKPLSFVEATTLNITYEINLDELTESCTDFCKTCDYTIYIYVHHIDDPDNSTVDTLIISASDCDGGISDTSLSLSYDLEPGAYLVEKRAFVNNVIPESITEDEVSGTTYRDSHSDSVEEILEEQFAEVLDTIYAYLEDYDLDNLYAYLDNSADVVTNSLYTFTGLCCDIEIPKNECNSYECPDNWPEFEEYYTSALKASIHEIWDTNTTSYSLTFYTPLYQDISAYGIAHISNYELGQIDTLIHNMLEDENVSYTCDQLWECWVGVAQSALTMLELEDAYGDDFDYDPIEQFLECTGKYYRDYTADAWTGVDDPDVNPGYMSHAYAFFYYVSGSSPDCEDALDFTNSNTWDVDSDKEPDGDPDDYGYDPYQYRSWEEFYNCVQGTDDPGYSATQYGEMAEDSCKMICDWRRDVFISELRTLYEDNGLIVQAPGPHWTTYDISISDFYLCVEMMVSHCKGYCELTVFYQEGSPYYGSHTAPGSLIDGQLYKVVLSDPTRPWGITYQGTRYGPNFLNGDQFYASSTPFYFIFGSGVLGTDIQVLPDSSVIDSIGSYEEYLAAQKAMAYGFHLALPDSETEECPDGYEMIDTVGWACGKKLLRNGGFTRDPSCGPLPKPFGGSCVTNWYDSHGDPMTVRTVLPNFKPKAARMRAWRQTMSVIDEVGHVPVQRDTAAGDGIAYEDTLVLKPGKVYCLSFDVRRDAKAAEVDHIYVRLTNRITPKTPSYLIPDPQPGSQTIYHDEHFEDTEWTRVQVFFTAERTQNTLFYFYPQQDEGSDLCRLYVDNVHLGPARLDSCDCVCFEWFEPTIEVDSNTIVFEAVPCEESTADYVASYIRQQVDECISAKLAEVKSRYASTCGDPDNIDDRLILQYSSGYHHYTLFYYDRAGNLIQTVPPKGVDDSKTSRDQHPEHSFLTEYEYNSLGQLVRTKNPDGGESNFWYNSVGQLRFSQNEQQVADGKYSFLEYDELGRVIEGGESGFSIGSFYDKVDKDKFPRFGSERVYTVYTTTASSIDYYGREQRFLQNRISYTYTDEDIYTYYSYDPLGTVEWVINELPGFGKTYIGYEYDQIAGLVTKVKYNEDGVDHFFQRYIYDADNRLMSVETSYDDVLWDKDITNQYYPHGPRERVEIGEDKIQGVDYVYTLQGALKAMNHPGLNSTSDPGGDGENGGENENFATDIFGMALGYFESDFDRTGSPFSSSDNSYLNPINSLYNGNITTWTSQVGSTDEDNAYEGFTGTTYTYDELNRITGSNFNLNDNSWTAMDDFHTAYTYDANSSILGLLRHGWANSALYMDSLTYHYPDESNRLNYIRDTVSSSNYVADLDDQESDNYEYDAIGNMVSDVSAGIDEIEWSANGKIKRVDKSGNEDDLAFLYDGMDNRVMKILKPEGTPDSTSWDTTFYMRGPNGKAMAIYQLRDGEFKLSELPIYGSKRTGLFKPEMSVTPEESAADDSIFTRQIGNKYYELTDHVGNVRAVITDIKLSETEDGSSFIFTADLKAYNHYYPFGSYMPGRQYNDSSYRYGFNGMERDDEVKGDGNSYTTFFRQYDPRIGRWLSLDPKMDLFPYRSPYVAFGNNPVLFVDPRGDAEGNRGDVIRHHAVYEITIDGETYKYGKAQSSPKHIVGSSGLPERTHTQVEKLRAQFPDADVQGKVVYDNPSISTDDVKKIETDFIRDKAKATGRIPDGNPGHNHLATEWDVQRSPGPRVPDPTTTTTTLNDTKGTKTTITKNSAGDVVNKTTTSWGGRVTKRALRIAPGVGLFVSGNAVASSETPEEATWNSMDALIGESPVGPYWDAAGLLLILSEALPEVDVSGGVGLSCFVPGTMVLMHDGSQKPIEKIQFGDVIKSVDMKTMTIGKDTVLELPEKPMYYPKIKMVVSNDTIIEFSTAHPFWVKGKGWCVYDPVRANKELMIVTYQLEQGDTIISYNSGKLKEVIVKSLINMNEEVEMYNVEFVKHNNNFFANGVLVHNRRITREYHEFIENMKRQRGNDVQNKRQAAPGIK